jgi:transcriptional regulator with XRE-family HTH domain
LVTIPEIICKYRAEQGLNQEQFANLLTENMPSSLSKQAVSYWENGNWKPAYYFLLTLTLVYTDWRRDMALECLAVLKPELYAPEAINVTDN